MPLYVLGLMGVTRRMRVFDDPSLQIWFLIAALGAALVAVGIVAFLLQIAVSIWRRNELLDTTGDPWDGRTLEWATSSPPPAYNFAFTPISHGIDAWWDMKLRGYRRPLEGFRPIHMPKNTGAGVFLAGLSTLCGLALVWYIWWLAALSFLGVIAVAIWHTFNYDRDFDIPAAEVTATEGARTRLLSGGA
jgi:cytochrome o ubiquinol oxidase subunit 1